MKRGEGATLNNIGAIYDDLGQYQTALEYFEQALAIRQKLGDLYGEGDTLNNIGETYRNQGQYQLALDYYQQALAIALQLGDGSSEGTLLNNIGAVYDNQSRYETALDHYEQALAIARQVGNLAGKGRTLNNQGGVYVHLGQYERALDYFGQALSLQRQIGDRLGEGGTLTNMGGVYDDLGQYDAALKHYEQALTIQSQLGDRASEGTTLDNIGVAYYALSQFEKALDYHERALTIRREVGDRAGEAATLNNIAIVYSKLDQPDRTMDYLEDALALTRQVGDRAGEGATLSNIGRTLLGTERFSEAEESLFAAIEVWESIRVELTTDPNRISLFETQAETYPLLQEVSVAEGKKSVALEIAERGRAQAFVRQLEERLSTELEQFDLPTPISINEIRAVANDRNATLVEYSIVPNAEELYTWVVRPTGAVDFRKAQLSSLGSPLRELVSATRASMGVRGLGVESRSTTVSPQYLRQLYQLLIEPIADLLPTSPEQAVIFIPQRELFLVPFPALQTAEGDYLIDRHTILTAPSIQSLRYTSRQSDFLTSPENSNALVLGNPIMPPLPITYGDPPPTLKPLPGAALEAEEIASLLETTPLIGDRGTETAVLAALPNARIIHLATHGLLDEQQGLGSAIALAPDSENDGLLTAADIFQMNLNPELAVLSACDTGRGDITGDGVVGLSRSLMAAGVPSAIVSLWSVPDAPTAELMEEFYRNWLKRDMDKAAALREAMLTVKERHPKPIDWAAFTLIGEAD